MADELLSLPLPADYAPLLMSTEQQKQRTQQALLPLLFWQGLDAALFSWRMGERTMSAVRIPIYPAKFAILAGVAVLMTQLLVDLVAGAQQALRGPAHGRPGAGGAPPAPERGVSV